MEFHPIDIVISLINITVLFILLRLILWKFVNNFLSSREKRVREELEDVEKRRLDAEALKAEYEERLEGLKASERDLMRESQIKASVEAEEILSDARDKAVVMMAEARERIADEKERAIVNARYEVAQLATDMAARILRREVSKEDSINAVNDFFRDAK